MRQPLDDRHEMQGRRRGLEATMRTDRDREETCSTSVLRRLGVLDQPAPRSGARRFLHPHDTAPGRVVNTRSVPRVNIPSRPSDATSHRRPHRARSTDPGLMPTDRLAPSPISIGAGTVLVRSPASRASQLAGASPQQVAVAHELASVLTGSHRPGPPIHPSDWTRQYGVRSDPRLDARVSLRDVQDCAGHADPRPPAATRHSRHEVNRYAAYAVSHELAGGN